MVLSDRQSQFKEVLKKILVGQAKIPFSELEQKAGSLAGVLFDDLTSSEIDEVIEILTQEQRVFLTPGGTVVDPETFTEWLEERRKSIQTPRWNAYEQLLVSRDWEEPVISELADQTDGIVELLGDPTRPGTWARRGLLMGDVQSGKTATYLGVLNKALDYGYRVVIVIGGHTNELRRQTQSRFDTDLLGIDSEYLDDNIANVELPHIGIGEIDPSLRANVMTTVRGDFGANKKSAGIVWVDSPYPTVFVIKKNAKLIANVTNYIRQQADNGILDIPLVVIDDESDWGTPNTGEETDPTKVNKEIRRLLNSSHRSSYLGITATPFANIFIDDAAADKDGDDLFPRDFIRVMPAPSTYLGIQQYFPVKGTHSAIQTEVEDCLALIPLTHKSGLSVTSIPKSMEDAIIQFFVGTAIRRLRDQSVRPASMMINVSRFNNVQEQVAALVEEFGELLVSVIQAELARESAARSGLAERIQDVWRNDFDRGDGTLWQEVARELDRVSSEVRFELVNSKTASERAKRRKVLTAEQRRAEDLRPTIFTGGDVLSRGLTLEGLQVSYFVREPRTMDTLMQMGRWFGYRPGFEDLVRVWVPQDTADDFQWSAETTDELRALLLEMKARKLTPKDFGLRVRTHPEGFGIVAANKAKNAETAFEGAVLWTNRLAEASRLSNKQVDREANRLAARSLVEAVERNPDAIRDVSEAGYPAWRHVPIEDIFEFFRRFRGHKEDPFFGVKAPGVPIPIFDALIDAKGASAWDVVFVNGQSQRLFPLGPEVSVRGSVRRGMVREGDAIRIKNRRVATSQNLVGSLSRDETAEALRRNLDKWPSQAAALAFLEHPVLLVFALTNDLEDSNTPGTETTVELGPDEPLVSVAVAFPKLDPDEALWKASRAQKYLVNTVWWRNMQGYVDDEGDDVPAEESDEF